MSGQLQVALRAAGQLCEMGPGEGGWCFYKQPSTWTCRFHAVAWGRQTLSAAPEAPTRKAFGLLGGNCLERVLGG